MFKDLELFLQNLEKKVDTILEKLEALGEKTENPLDKLSEEGNQILQELEQQSVRRLDKNTELPLRRDYQEKKEPEKQVAESLVVYTIDDAILAQELGEDVEYDKLSDEDKIKFNSLFPKENEEPIKEELSDMKKDLYFSLTKILKANSKFFERPLVNEEDIKLILESFLADKITADGMVALQDVKKSHTLWNLLTEQKEVLKNLFTMDGFDFAEAMVIEDFHEGFFKPFLNFYNLRTNQIIEDVKKSLDELEPTIKHGEILEIIEEKTELSLLDFHGDITMETKDHIEQYINQRFVEKNEDDEEIMYMGNKTFVLTDEFIEQDGEKLYQVKYKKAYSYKYGDSTYGVAEGTVGGYVSKKAFIGENVTIGPNVKVPQYCVLAKGTVVTESIPPFTKSFEEDFCITKLTLLDLNKDPYTINEDRIVI